MGKCLSCCEPENEPTHNGHTGGSSPPKTSNSVMMSQSVILSNSRQSYAPHHPQQQQQYTQHETKSLQRLSSAGEVILSKPQTNGDRKMFAPYPKLPPIRKPSNSDIMASSKRTSVTSKDISEQKIGVLYEKYKDPEEDCILADGIESFCNDLEVRPEEFRVLVLAWKFEAETMCRFTRHEFATGCRKLHADSVKGIQLKFGEMLAEVEDRQVFKEFYRWTYKFGLDTDVGQRTLPVDMAISLWRLVFSQHQPSILKRWLLFLERHAHIRGIPKDTWDMFLNFSETVGDDLSNYDDTEAWPSLFDDFVEYENDRENQNLTPDKESVGE